MARILFSILLALTPAAASAQAQVPVDVRVANFKFTPATIRLHHGQHYLLRLTNTAGGGHDFVAPGFFAAARLGPGTPVADGGVDVDGHATVTVALTAPAAGRYPVHCSHFLHSTFGMKGEIVVD